jgi:hypothetical protein
MKSNNSKTSKSIIDTYTSIYPVELVVANQYTTLEELQKLYTYIDETELDDQITSEDSNATVTQVYRKSDHKACCLVKYNNNKCSKFTNKREHYISTIAHEAGHVTLDIYEYINQNICNCSSEPFCYLLGWVTQCIYRTLTKKP